MFRSAGQTRSQALAKRAIDVAAAGVGLVVLAPVIVLVALAIRASVGRPVLFRQIRPGRGGQPFWLLKFRTMNEKRSADGELLPDVQRLTRVGRFVRSTSLDELPQLWNVLKGEMSLVGPRPLLMDYLPLYSVRQARRHDVRPGITGWAQVNGRNAIGWNQKLEMDVWYVEHQGLWLDAKILMLTFAKVLRRDGISQQGHATTEPFRGNFDVNQLADSTGKG